MYNRRIVKGKPTVTVAVHTRNRYASVLTCLDSIKRQTLLPDQLIVVENITEHAYFSRDVLRRYFNNTIRCIYRMVTDANRAQSRNLSLSLSTSTIYVSIDHDAYLADSRVLERVVRLHTQYKNIACFVGPVHSIGLSCYELFSSALYYPDLIREKMRRITVFPTTFFSANMDSINKMKLRFNVRSYAEDIDFFWRLTRQGGSLVYTNTLSVYAEFPDNMIDFIKKRYLCALNNADLYVLSKGNIDIVSWLFIDRKIKLYFYPIAITRRLFNNAKYTINSKQISKRYMLLSLVEWAIVAIGFFVSQTGRKLFKENLQNTFYSNG